MKESSDEINATVSHWVARLGETQRTWAQVLEAFLFVRDRKALMVEGDDWRVERQNAGAIGVTFYQGPGRAQLALEATAIEGK